MTSIIHDPSKTPGRLSNPARNGASAPSASTTNSFLTRIATAAAATSATTPAQATVQVAAPTVTPAGSIAVSHVAPTPLVVHEEETPTTLLAAKENEEDDQDGDVLDIDIVCAAADPYESILEHAAVWTRQLESVRDTTYFYQVQNAILLDHLTMAGADDDEY